MNILKKPIKIKGIEFSNRIVLPPMATAKADDGVVTKKLLDYYDEKSKGGYLGLVITEHMYVRADGIAHKGQLSVSRDSDVEGLAQLAKTIHNNNSKAIAQISHAGSNTTPEITGCEVISASAVRNPSSNNNNGPVPHGMSIAEIKDLVNSFATAALRVKKAGFDGVEIHSAHAYLLNQFYSPLSNKRTDGYGGSLAKRLRIHLEIVKAIRNAVGDDFIIAIRLGASDYMPGGNAINDGVEASTLLEKAGVDILDISGGFCGTSRADNKLPGYFSDSSAAIKQKVNVPVILTGGITEKKTAEKLLETSNADLIGIGRAMLKDSLWAKKAIESL